MPRKPKWLPRASSLGYYMSCSYRAAFDRALHEGVLDLPTDVAAEVQAKKLSSPYADLGTCIHHHMQVGMQCVFPDLAHAPEPEQYLNAAGLFGGSMDKCQAAIRASAVLGANNMPAAPDGKPWIAELAVKTPHYTGHLDFLSQDGTVLVDLKTTSKPPLYAKCKPAHLVQVLAYAHAVNLACREVRVRKIVVLYVDSLRASWALPVEIDATDEGIQEYMGHIAAAAKMLASAWLFKVASPSIGDVCEEWCPYTSICRDRYRPVAGTVEKNRTPTMKAPL